LLALTAEDTKKALERKGEYMKALQLTR